MVRDIVCYYLKMKFLLRANEEREEQEQQEAYVMPIPF